MERTIIISLSTIPAEILNRIFEFVCAEECDMNLLAVCSSIRCDLLDNPTFRFAQAFLKGNGSEVDVVGRPWCTEAFVMGMQIAWLKRTTKETWNPYLRRHGIDSPEGLYQDLWRQIDPLIDSRLDREGVILSNDTDTGYSWTSIAIWPGIGKISIRDRLLNQRLDIVLPLLQLVEMVKQTTVSNMIASTYQEVGAESVKPVSSKALGIGRVVRSLVRI